MFFYPILNSGQTLPRQVDRNDQILHYNGYIVSYNESHEQANWVFYTLNQDSFNCETNSVRKNNFATDYGFLTTSSYLADYKYSGYDRGHLKPAMCEPCNQNKIDETFNMVNISPQEPSFNRGVWKKLENHVKRLVNTCDSVHVYTGGVLSYDLKKIGDVSVPEQFFKIIYVFKSGLSHRISYIIPNKKSDEDIDTFEVPFEFLVKMVGFYFP
tara:strand:+ start:1469 stop:2107 length:639 start_codon:yes stop_codon:yes gene_type:complete